MKTNLGNRQMGRLAIKTTGSLTAEWNIDKNARLDCTGRADCPTQILK